MHSHMADDIGEELVRKNTLIGGVCMHSRMADDIGQELLHKRLSSALRAAAARGARPR